MRQADYLVTREVAERAGVREIRYRTADGRYVLNAKDLRKIVLEPEEFTTGLEGVELVSSRMATRLIKENGSVLGDAGITQADEVEGQTVDEGTPSAESEESGVSGESDDTDNGQLTEE